MKKVNEASRDTRRNKKDQIITPLVTEFNPRTIDFNSVINKHWNITQTTEKGRKYLKAQLSVLYRRPRNLKNAIPATESDARIVTSSRIRKPSIRVQH